MNKPVRKLPTPIFSLGNDFGGYSEILFTNGSDYQDIYETAYFIFGKEYIDTLSDALGQDLTEAFTTTEEGDYMYKVSDSWNEGIFENGSNFWIFVAGASPFPSTFKLKIRNEGYLDSDWGTCEYKEKLPTPVISQVYAGADAAGVITNIAILDNRSDYPDESIIHIRYIEAGVTDWLEDPISNMDDTGMIYFLPESAGQMEVYISCTGYQDSDVASIEYEDVRPTPQLYDKLSDGSVICYDRGASYGEYLIINGDIIKQDSGSNWRYMICEGNDLNHYETNLGTDYESNGSYSGKKWGFSGTTTGINDTAIGSGKDNTDSLINENNNKDDSIWYYVNQHRTNTGKPWHVPSKEVRWWIIFCIS